MSLSLEVKCEVGGNYLLSNNKNEIPDTEYHGNLATPHQTPKLNQSELGN